MKFITLLALASVSSAIGVKYRNFDEIKVNENHYVPKSYSQGNSNRSKNYKAYEGYVAATSYKPASSVTAYKTVTKCSKPSDNSTPIHSPSTQKPNYPVSKSTQSYDVPSNPSSNPAYSEPSKPSSESEPKPTGSYPSSDLSEQTIEMLCRVNAIRAEVGKKPYKVDQRLMLSAQKHSEDQAEHKKMTHTGTKIKSSSGRIKAAGYPATSSSENVAWNYVNLAHVVEGWKKSPGHYRALIGDYDCFGWGEKDRYYTQNFGKGAECTNQVIPQCKSYPPFNPEDMWKNMKYY